MKFVSKSSNLLVVLRAGLSAQPITGTPAKPTISVRFKDGIAEVQQEELVEMMLAHPGFNSDFISTEEATVDPYASMRKGSEPDHIRTEIVHGTPMKREVSSDVKRTLPADIQKMIQDAAAEMAKQMLPGMVEATLKTLIKGNEKTVESKGKKKAGRPAKKAKEVSEPVEESAASEDINLAE